MADGAREVMFVKECEGCRIEVHYGVFHHVIILCTANLLRWLSIVWEWLQEKSGMNEKPLKDINWRNQRRGIVLTGLGITTGSGVNHMAG